MSPDWQSFIETQGATLVDGMAVFASAPPGQCNLGECNLFDLSHLGLIRATGADAETFLQGQLTNDTRTLIPTRSQLSGFCSPKGRMLASIRLFRLGDSILLQLPRERLGAVLQRLRLFVLRSDVTLDDASDELVQVGLHGTCALGILGDLAAPEVDDVVQHPGISVVRLPGVQARFLLAGQADIVREHWQHAVHAAIPASADDWRLLDIRAGVPAIYDQTVEAFVPQMTNLQLINGVSFTKGCYTGQEIVARMQYLGKLKRRMYHVAVAGTCPAPGTELYSPASDSGQGAGRIVTAALAPGGSCEALAVIETAAVSSGGLRIGDAAGSPLEILDLPYVFEDASEPAVEPLP